MKRTKNWYFAFFATVLLGAITPSPSAAYCLWGAPPAVLGLSRIPVYVRNLTWTEFVHPNGTPWTSQELVSEVEWAIHIVNNSTSAATPPLYFGGFFSCNDSDYDGRYVECIQPNSITVVATRSGTAVCVQQAGHYYNVDSSLVELENSYDCDTRWSQFDGNHQFSDILTSALIHEIGHSLGLDDQYQCTTAANPACTDTYWGACASMKFGRHSGSLAYEYFIDDALGLRALWGTRGHIGRLHSETTTAVTWTSLGTATTGTNAVRWGSGASNNPSSTSMFLAHRDDTILKPHAMRWNSSASSWTTYNQTSLYQHMGPVGAAEEPSHSSSFYMAGQTQTNINTYVASSRHASSSAIVRTLQPNRTRHSGSDGTYDPASGFRLQTYRDNSSRIVIQALDAAGTVVLTGTFSQTTSSTPSIACAPTGMSQNCILVYTKAVSGSQRYMTSFQFGILTNGAPQYYFDVGSVVTSGHVALDRPIVAFLGTSAAGSFLVALRRPSNALSTHQGLFFVIKSTIPNDPWSASLGTRYVTSDGDLAYALGGANGRAQLLMGSE